VGAPLDLGIGLDDAISLPDARTVIAVPHSGSSLLTIDLGVTPPLQRPISGGLVPAEMTLSPSGKSLALAYPADKRVDIVYGLPDHPVIAAEVSTAEVPFSLHHVVLNDAGTLLLLTFLEDDRETIYRWNSTEGFRMLASTAHAGAMSFVGSSDAVYSDSGTNEVFLARNVNSQSVTQFLAGPADGVSGPVGIAPATAGGFYVANSVSGNILSVDANGRIYQSRNCNCEVTGLYPMSPGIFRLTTRLDQPLYLLDDSKSPSRIVYVPAVH
jgi:hypothetical protein